MVFTEDMTRTNTAKDMIESGRWIKVGDKHYRHESGAECVYDFNAFGWRVPGVKGCWKALHTARWFAEQAAA